ncbi:glycosyltransferase [Paenibacillus hunanensis]|uniref:Glycosyltransferase involved in cell wall biosynthesis n=1 Tax=Paenibacillus hunanensis TaxID=539262 RepID=A0ABU1ITH4_9BACL|nr:glycosyltransferase [Paenibacillus hunanensis]MDR6242553.1 glycosyltransferase involved in cell wall biosynthesis [Paenibacillus hunanensis]GGJ00946.1 hypothetical protein GCM10008022_07300 [Paenibacillus hunanensis]
MNIWFLTSEFPPDYGGGIGMYVDNAARMMAEAGHKVKVIVRDAKETMTETVNPNLEIYRFLHMQGSVYETLGYWTALSYQYAEEVIHLINTTEEKPDIIEVQDYNAIGYYLMLKKWQHEPSLKDIPIVMHLHTPTFELDKVNQAPRFKFPNYWIGQMEKFCMVAADALLSPSQFLKDQIQHISPNNQIRVINLPYELDDYQEGYTRNFDDNTFLYFGRSEYRKGVQQMIKGAARLWDQGYEFKLKLIGGDTYFHPRARNLGEFLQERYKKYIDQGKLIFKAAIPPKDLNPEILKAKAVIIPSLYENFPYSCLTSMWLGAPMLVSKSGGQAEMVGEEQKAGLIFDWGKEGDFENKLLEYIKMDQASLISKSQHSHERIRQLCNVEANLEMRINYFKEVIAQHKLAPKEVFPTLLQVPKKPIHKEITSEKGLLSIIIPYYNLGKHLEETLDSALKNDYQNFEIIIVNDGTNDEYSLEVLNRYRHSELIRIIDIPNGGLANARNVGALESKGEYITFLDADDLIENSFYERSVKLLDSYKNVSFVYCWLQYFENSTFVWPTFNTELPYFLGANMLSAFAVVRREEFLNFGLNMDKMEYGLEDYAGWLSMVMNGCVGISIPEKLVRYRVRSDSMSRQFNPDMLLYLRDYMSHQHKELYDKHSVELFNLIDANGPGYLWNNPSLSYPPVGYTYPNATLNSTVTDPTAQKQELMRIANSKWGQRLIRIVFKLRLHRIFK